MDADSGNVTPINLTNCYNTADIYGLEAVGGIVGKASLSELTIASCYNSGTVTGSVTGNTDVGYIAGSTKAAILNSYYLLIDIESSLCAVGYGSGDNHARPVSAVYLSGAAFAAALGEAYKTGTGYPVLIIEA
jgi:hypothetical protein